MMNKAKPHYQIRDCSLTLNCRLDVRVKQTGKGVSLEDRFIPRQRLPISIEQQDICGVEPSLLKLYCKRVVGTLGNKILKFGEQSNKEDGECIVRRKIPKTPYKILDAPALKDDFYLNLVDWSSTDNLAVSLGACVYLWSAATSKVTKLCQLRESTMYFESSDFITSVVWSQRGNSLAIGTNRGNLQIWDSEKIKKVCQRQAHKDRIGVLAWSNSVLTSGSKDKSIANWDFRCYSSKVSQLNSHKQEVCGLKWSPDQNQLASGGNDNKVLVWNNHSTQPIIKFSKHKAAVKAIAWSPHQHGLLASGGGTADRMIRFWNTLTAEELYSLDSGSQVCNLSFSKNVNQLISTHGYSQNQIVIWKYPQMHRLTTLLGHTSRVLYLALSPDGKSIVTGAGDQTLRFWTVFPSNPNQRAKHQTSQLNPFSIMLR